MEPTNQDPWDALSESAKAFANLILGEFDTNILRDNVLSYSELLAENEQLKAEAASLNENLSFKDKYENLQKEFRKVAAERDSLSSQALKFNHMSSEYDRMKDAYQKMKDQLAAEKWRSSFYRATTSRWAALENLYKGFQEYCSKNGLDINRFSTQLFLQFQLQDTHKQTLNISFRRESNGQWSVLK